MPEARFKRPHSIRNGLLVEAKMTERARAERKGRNLLAIRERDFADHGCLWDV